MIFEIRPPLAARVPLIIVLPSNLYDVVRTEANLSRPIKNMIIATAKNNIRTITVLSCKNVLVILSTEAAQRPIAVTPVPTVNIDIRLTAHQSIAPNA